MTFNRINTVGAVLGGAKCSIAAITVTYRNLNSKLADGILVPVMGSNIANGYSDYSLSRQFVSFVQSEYHMKV